MEESTGLCKELFDYLTAEYPHDNCKLSFEPDQQGVKTPFFIDKNESQAELVCFKSTFVKIFKGVHKEFTELVTSSTDLDNCCKIDDMEIYYMTVGLFLTTTENKTVFNLHQSILIKIIRNFKVRGGNEKELYRFLEKELRMVQRLLTSTNNKLNKSSSMWLLYKKLYILILELFPENKLDYLDACFKAARLHPANYYCWNTIRWFFDNIPKEKKLELFTKVKKFCFQRGSDCSSWDTLSYIVCQRNRKIDHNRNEYRRISKMFEEILPGRDPVKVDNSFPEFSVSHTFQGIIEMIELLRLDKWPPYLCLLNLLKTFPEIDRSWLFQKWTEELRVFEEEFGHLYFEYDKPLVPEKYADNLLLSRDIKYFGFKRSVMNYF